MKSYEITNVFDDEVVYVRAESVEEVHAKLDIPKHLINIKEVSGDGLSEDDYLR